MSEQIRTVAVAGATGFVGRHVVAELLARGFGVRALVRNPAKASEIFHNVEGRDRLIPIQAETLTAEATARLVDGTTACINCIGAIREQQGERFESLHQRMPQLLSKSCKAAGAERFIQISALGADPDGRAAYQKTKYEGEQIVRRSGLNWTILRPSLVVGTGAEVSEMMVEWARGKSQPFLFMPYFTRLADGQWTLMPGETVDPAVAPIPVDDLARAACDALDNEDTVGEIFNCVGSETTSWPNLLTFVRDNAKDTKPNIKPGGIPAPAAFMAATAAGLVGMGNLLPYDAGMASMASEDSTASLEKFQAHFGFTPGSYQGALRQAVADL